MSKYYENISDIKVLPLHSFSFPRTDTGEDIHFKRLREGSAIKIGTVKSGRKNMKGQDVIVAVSFDVTLILLVTNYQTMLNDGLFNVLTNQKIKSWNAYLGASSSEDPVMYGSILSIELGNTAEIIESNTDFNIDVTGLKPDMTINIKTIVSKDILEMEPNLFKQFLWS